MTKPPSSKTAAQKALGFLTGAIVTIGLFVGIYYLLAGIKSVYPDITLVSVIIVAGISYLVLAFFAAKRPDLEVDDPDAPMDVLPVASDTAWTGLYFLLPIIILLWCILPTPEKLSPFLAAYYACLAMSFIALTQHIIKGMFRGNANIGPNFKRGLDEWVDGMISGARNMISIGIATAAAGVIVGAISITGAHAMVGELVEFLSGGNLLLMLILVAIMSLILGMGLPTTANYLVVSSLMAPVIIALGAKSGLIVPLVAVHLFVFYFGILADDTPPVGLAAYAAAAISKGDPIKTGVQGFMYDIRTALLPFLFLFNTDLLLIDVGPLKAVLVFVIATIAMMLFAAATQGWFFTRSKIWETVALLAIAFTLFRPGMILDQISPRFEERPGIEAIEIAAGMPADAKMRIRLVGVDFNDEEKANNTSVLLNLGAEGTGEERFTNAGYIFLEDEGKVVFEGFEWDFKDEDLKKLFNEQFVTGDPDLPLYIDKVLVENERMAKEWFFIPALVLLGLIIFIQRARHAKNPPAPVEA